MLIYDSKNVCYVSHFSHSALRTKSGFPTGLLFGFLKDMLHRSKLAPGSAMVFCWEDDGLPNWRKELYPLYKQNRDDGRRDQDGYKDMMSQMPHLKELLVALGFHCLQIPGVETDDLIGVLTEQMKQSADVRIVSTDRDFYQLVEPRVKMWSRERAGERGFRDVLVSEKEVELWLGAPVEAFVEIRAMAGDAADNLKGLPAIGPKRAAQLWHAGFRVANIRGSAFSCCAARIEKEYKLARIVRDPRADVFTAVQKDLLVEEIACMVKKPYRKCLSAAKTVTAQEKLYSYLERYELDDLFRERFKILQLP